MASTSRTFALDELIGLGFLITWQRLDALEGILMGLADTITQLSTEDAEIKADADALVILVTALNAQVVDLQAQIAALSAAGVTPDQLAALQTVADHLGAIHTEIAQVLPSAPPAG